MCSPLGQGGLGGDLVPGAERGALRVRRPFCCEISSLSALPVPGKREQVLEQPRLRAFCAHRGIPTPAPPHPVTGTAGCVWVWGSPLMRRLFGGSSSGLAPRFQAVSAGGGAGAGCAGWLEDLTGPREEAPQVFFGPLCPRRATRAKLLAYGPWHCGCQGGIG